ncbi:hypothetical protein DEI97_002330 [Curtobacterium sp. MCLR17_032]|uniref:hypothetical protein n=1 Tax=Curtobacterium sp. MCLR17_032 TaxID=2175650 RepID=UPI0024DFD255|nr:hypothetical protein [Curtobacterium sp. MCLR17_032]WIE61995.1 hypothetical protein DEI97_002330 [Curtobacterium sp. MCLR17_032]
MAKKKTVGKLGAGVLAATTVISGLGFGIMPAGAATETKASSTHEYEVGEEGAHFQLISKTDTGYSYLAVGGTYGVVKTSSTLEEAKEDAIPITAYFAETANGADYWKLHAEQPSWGDQCLVAGGTSQRTPIAYLYTCNYGEGTKWTVEDGSFKSKVNDSKAGWLWLTSDAVPLNSNYGNLLAMSNAPTSHSFVGLPTTLAGFGADVQDVDLEAGTALLDGTAPADATDVEVSYLDKDSKKKTYNAAAKDGKWSQALSALALGNTSVHLKAYNGAELIAESDVDVDLPVTPLSVQPELSEANVEAVAKLTGSASKNTTIKVKSGTKQVATTMTGEDGSFEVPVNAPNAAGDYELTATQEIRDEDATPQDVTIPYGAGVAVSSPENGAELDAGQPLVVSGTAQTNSLIRVYEKGNPRVVLGQATATNGYRIVLNDLEDREYQLVVAGVSKGNNVTTAEVTVNPGKSDVDPLVISSPADGSITVNPTKTVQFAGTGEAGARVQIRTQGSNPRTVIDTTVRPDGTWDASGDLAHDVAYTLDTIYTVPGQDPVTGLYHVKNVTGETVADSNVVTPAENAVVVAPEKQVTISGTATTGTEVKIWNWAGKDRQVAQTVTANGSGEWDTVATLNNESTQYGLYIEYTKGGVTTTQTRNITVTNSETVTQPFSVDTPAEGSTVVAADKQVRISGKGTTGTEVKIWNWAGKDRQVAAPVTVNALGEWETVATLNNQNTAYGLLVEYTVPGGAMQTETRTITVTNSETVTQPFSVDTPAEGSTVVAADKQVRISGKGTTGTEVKIWNWAGKDRQVAAPVTVNALGEWETVATLNNQNTAYGLLVEYTVPGGAMQTETRTITVTDSAR